LKTRECGTEKQRTDEQKKLGEDIEQGTKNNDVRSKERIAPFLFIGYPIGFAMPYITIWA
jgi:hypothetical protein